MASCTAFSKIEFSGASGPPSEAPSEVSSVESDWSDIRTIALKLGISNPDNLATERFKVDRTKLENLILTDISIDGENGAESFFDNIMKTTSTYVIWPCKLKVGAKSRKDPHVRVVGKQENVQEAKEKILAALDSRNSKVIMKMDVSYTDHSYIIGRGGNSIKHIMEETTTHIHFPDSNRSNPTEKSNQVSLCGNLEGVERARSLVRLAAPMLISFELPIMAPERPMPDHDTPYVREIEENYNVQVIFSTRPKLHSSLILVKGSERDAARVQEATQLLINYTCDILANQIEVHMQLEISPQNHEVVKGRNGINLLRVMERTKTKIIFPDINDMNIKPIKKSQVTITGSLDGVYRARQQLIGSLPIVLIFDHPDTTHSSLEVANLSNKYGVFILLRQKQKLNNVAIVIKGFEKFVDKIYEARHEILKLQTPVVTPSIPSTYFSPTDKDMEQSQRRHLTALLSSFPDSPITTVLPLTPSPHNSQYNNNNNNNISAFPKFHQNASTSSAGPPYNNNHNSKFLHQDHHHSAHSQYHYNSFKQLTNNNNNNNNNNNSAANNSSSSNNHMNSNINHIGMAANYLNVPSMAKSSSSSVVAGAGVAAATASLSSLSLSSSLTQLPQPPQRQSISPRSNTGNTSGYQSFSSSTNSLEQSYPSGSYGNLVAAAGSTSRHQYSPGDSNFENDRGRRLSDGSMHPAGTNGNDYHRTTPHYDMKQPNISHEAKLTSLVGPNWVVVHDIETQPLSASRQNSFDFDMKRVIGYKAMERAPHHGEIRTPTSHWMGMGLSHTSPAPLETANYNSDDTVWNRNHQMSPYNLGMTTGLVDSTPTNRRLHISQHKNIHSLLTSLGLEHYIKTFVMNEIDLDMFGTLTEDNLIELGITAFGARKKLLVAIHSLAVSNSTASGGGNSGGNRGGLGLLNRNDSPRFSGSAAPGAERRTSNAW